MQDTQIPSIAPIITEVATRLSHRLLDTKYAFNTALNFGTSFSVLQNLPKAKKPQSILTASFNLTELNTHTAQQVLIDAQHPLPFRPKTFDLVFSNFLLHQLENVPQFLAQIGRALKENGLLLASTLGNESFWQLYSACQHLNITPPTARPLPDLQTVGTALKGVGFNMPVVDKDTITLLYPSTKTLWQEVCLLQGICLEEAPLPTADTFKKLASFWEAHFKTKKGYFPLTLEVIYLHGWRPHKSQQTPLPRGSARVQLQDYV